MRANTDSIAHGNRGIACAQRSMPRRSRTCERLAARGRWWDHRAAAGSTDARVEHRADEQRCASVQSLGSQA